MTQSNKTVFAVIIFLFTCASAVHCEDTQVQVASKRKLQSAIDYITTRRTPRETLACYIAQADVEQFKHACDILMQSNITSEERQLYLQELAIIAQEVKQQLQTNIETMNNKIEKLTLAKGTMQAIAGTALLTTIASCLGILYQVVFMDCDDLNTSSLYTLAFKTPPLKYISGSYETIMTSVLGKIFGTDLLGEINCSSSTLTCVNLTSALVGTALGVYGIKYGIKNIENGLNYTAYLEQQIKNIDEISEFIQTQLTLH